MLLLFGLFVPMGWGAPEGPALVIRNSVAIVPDVAGEVIEVPVVANTPLKAGDVLFRIDPVPFQAQLDALAAQLKFEETRLAETTQLARTNAGRVFDVEQRAGHGRAAQGADRRRAVEPRQDGVRAPADGYVTNLALRKGARVANLPLAPVMAFIDTSETILGIEIAQIDSRFVAPGQPVELTFKSRPGEIHTGKVVRRGPGDLDRPGPGLGHCGDARRQLRPRPSGCG